MWCDRRSALDLNNQIRRKVCYNERMGDVLTTKEAARRADVHIDTMRRWIRDGVIDEKYVKRVGMMYLIDSAGIPPEGERPQPGRPRER